MISRHDPLFRKVEELLFWVLSILGVILFYSALTFAAPNPTLKEYTLNLLQKNTAIKNAAQWHRYSAAQQDFFYLKLEELEKSGQMTLDLDIEDDLQRRINVFLARLAWNFYVDKFKLVSWNLTDYREEELTTLLRYDEVFMHVPPLGTENFNLNPERTFAALQNLRGSSQTESIYNLVEFIEHNVTHQIWNPKNQDFTVPSPQSVGDFLNGGAVGSCQINGDFLCAAAAVLNIPCTTKQYRSPLTPLSMKTHRYIDFPQSKLTLAHGDDPYSMGHFPGIFLKNERRQRYLESINTDFDFAVAQFNYVDFLQAHKQGLSLDSLLDAAQSPGVRLLTEGDLKRYQTLPISLQQAIRQNRKLLGVIH
jgi:hypothetical protein